MVDPLSHFSFLSVLHNWCSKGRGMCYSVYKRHTPRLVGKTVKLAAILIVFTL